MRYIALILFALTAGSSLLAQNDTVLIRTGTIIAGKIVGLSKETINIETKYTKGSIPVKLGQVAAIHSHQRFVILMNAGVSYIGTVDCDTAHDEQLHLKTNDSIFYISADDIFKIEMYKQDRWTNKLKLNADIGYTATKADRSQQISLGINAGYATNQWEFAGDFSSFASRQDSNSVSRGSISGSAAYRLKRNWLFMVKTSRFSSTEQNLDHRVNYYLGIGKYLIRSEDMNLSFTTGATHNQEKFHTDSGSFKSAELFLTGHFNVTVLKELELETEATLYPNLSESGRLRSYFYIDLSYRFAKHFNVELEYTLNTDSKPPVTSSRSDHIISFELGWKLH